MAGMSRSLTQKDRFLLKVAMPENKNECWEWIGHKRKKGYGTMQFDNQKQEATHASYFLYVGEIPDGLYVLHHCDNPSCVNPDHLFLGTQKDNICDCMKKGRMPSRTGERNGRSKLSDDSAAAIRLSAESSRSLSEKYKVSQQTIRSIRRGERWSGLEVLQK